MGKKYKPMYALGIMSGTSADGIDCAIIKIDGEEKENVSILSSSYVDYPQEVKDKVRHISDQKISDSNQSDNLDSELSVLYANAAEALIASSGIKQIDIVGCHGQTVNHRPNDKAPFSLQLARGDIIARRLNLPVITNFRAQDIAAGGQGAPLTPGFHQAVFSHQEKNHCIVNIGGIANITYLPSDSEKQVIGFDTGPGNGLMDAWCRSHFDCAYDNNGELAKGGVIHLDLLNLLLNDPYFSKTAPKSTGLEYFSEHWLKHKLAEWDCRDQCTERDILTTITALTAKSIADQINHSELELESAFLCGGGAKNKTLVEMIKHRSKVELETTEALGIHPQLVEAAAFAWMAYRTFNELTSTLPSVTGASEPTIAGTISLP